MAKRPSSPSGQKPKTPRAHTPQKVWKRIHLKDWREFRGHSSEELAELAGVSLGTISQIENRRSAGSADSLEKLAQALKIQVGELLDVKPDKGKRGSVLRIFVADEDRARVERLVKALLEDQD